MISITAIALRGAKKAARAAMKANDERQQRNIAAGIRQAQATSVPADSPTIPPHGLDIWPAHAEAQDACHCEASPTGAAHYHVTHP